MTKTMTSILAATVAAGAIALASPVFAQASKVATIDGAGAIFGSSAIRTAMQQIETKYAAQLKSVSDRSAQLQAQLKPLYDALDTNKDGQLDQNEQRAAASKPQAKQIQDAQTAAETQMNTTLEPVRRAQVYVFDQMSQRYNTALDGQVRTKQIGLIVPSNNVVRSSPGTDITTAVRTEIDKPLAIDPPANWQPTQAGLGLLQAYGQLLEAQQERAAAAAAQRAPAAGAPAATAPRPAAPATPAAPTGR